MQAEIKTVREYLKYKYYNSNIYIHTFMHAIETEAEVRDDSESAALLAEDLN